ncbi:MAG: GHKL domain-containing protein [Lachnospiraceae bacterium]|nr:GHKL domain-containing protein [Lachnospiraceae bacterium]
MISLIFWGLYRLFYILVDKHTLEYQSDLMERHCQEVQTMYRQIRGWRHDYHNHIQTMKAYLAMGKTEELDAYFNELDQDLTMIDSVVKTGNVMIDAILNSKISLAKQKGIAVDAKAIVPMELGDAVSEVDLSLIIGNLMDNAMEACMRVDDPGKRFIRVYIDVMKGELYIYVMNATSGKLKRVGKIYETIKDSRHHGFGLMRIDKAVERCHGYLERADEEGVFATEVLLPL